LFNITGTEECCATTVDEVHAAADFAETTINKGIVPNGKGVLPAIDVTAVEFHAFAVHVNGVTGG